MNTGSTIIILIALLQQIICQQYFPTEGNIPLNSSFALIKNITNFYFKPDEQFHLKLDLFFRGNFLKYSHYLSILNNETEVSTFVFDNDLVQISDPYEELVVEDFKQTETQRSLPQTSVIYSDPNSHIKYFIFVDYMMQLYIYDITEYYMYSKDIKDQKVPIISITDLYNPTFINSLQRACTNLLILDKDLLFLNCLASSNNLAVTLIIDFSVPTLVKVTSYQKSTFIFSQLQDSKFLVLQKLGDDYIMINKLGKTSCMMEVSRMTNKGEMTVIRRIIEFQEEPRTEEEIERGKIALPDIKEGGCEQQEPSDRYLDEMRLSISFLQIYDIKQVPFHDNVVIATDYIYGILFFEIICTNQTNQTIQCSYTPLTVIKEQSLGEITLIKDESLLSERILYVQRVNPPWLLEVQYTQRLKPSIRRIFAIDNDEGQYIGMSIVDGNEDFVVTQLMSTEQIKPVFRIYKRSLSFFSVGHAEFTISEFYDPGTFMQFVSSRDNYILVKTSDVFKIILLQQQNMIINATNYTSLQRKGYLDKTIEGQIYIRDVNHQEMSVKFHMMIVSTQRGELSLRKYNADLKNQEVPFFYNCGELSLKINIDNLFEGSKRNNLQIIDLNPEGQQGLFEPSRYSFESKARMYLGLKTCSIKAIVENVSAFNRLTMLQCLQYGGNSLVYMDLLTCGGDNPYILQNITISSSAIIEFVYDQNLRELFALSNTTSGGKKGAVIHIMKFYNMLSWENSIDLNDQYKELGGDFEFRQFNAMTYQRILQMGTILSEARNEGVFRRTTLVIFDLEKNTHYANLQLRASHEIYIPLASNASEQIRIQHSRMDSHGNIWVMLSNQTLNLYYQRFADFQNKAIIDRLYFKRAFSYANVSGIDPEDIFQNFHYLEESPETDKHILFFGKNKMFLQRFVRDTLDFQRLMFLPLYYNGQSDEDLELDIRYEFVINQLARDVTFAKYAPNMLIFVLMKRYAGKSSLIGYTLFVYDINKSGHGALIVKQQLPSDILIDDNQSKIEILSLDDQSDSLDVYLFIDLQTILVYNLKFRNEIEISHNDRERLKQQCSTSNLVLRYQIYPNQTNGIDEKVDIIIRANNTGLAIVPVQYHDEFTVTTAIDSMKQQDSRLFSEGYSKRGGDSSQEQDTLKSQKQDELQSQESYITQYSLHRMFRGHNLSFALSCPQGDLQQNENMNCSQIASVQTQIRQFNMEIEVLGSSVQLLAFFVIDPMMLFFDQQFLHVYYPEKESFESYDLRIQKGLDSPPIRYFMKSLTDVRGQVTNFLVYQTKSNSFGISLIYSKLSNNNTADLNINEDFTVFEDVLYLQKAYSLMTVPWKIEAAEIYMFNTLNPFHLNENDEPNTHSIHIRLVLLIIDKELLYNSLIKFYDVTFDTPGSSPVYKYNTAKLISVNRLNLDTFLVNSIAMLSEDSTKPILILGIENYGLILYDLLEYKILKYLSLVEHYETAGAEILDGQLLFTINSLIPSIGMHSSQIFQAVVNNNGVFSIRMGEDGSFEIQNTYMEASLQKSTKYHVAVGHLGYAFIQGSNEEETRRSTIQMTEQKTQPILKFFSFYAGENSKAIGAMPLEDNEDCRYLTSLPFNMTRRNFLPTVTLDSMITVAICGGSTLKLKAFDYYPDLLINISLAAEDEGPSVSKQTLVIASVNVFDKSSNVTVEVIILNQERELHPSLIGVYFGVPLILLVLIIQAQKTGSSNEISNKLIEKPKKDTPAQVVVLSENQDIVNDASFQPEANNITSTEGTFKIKREDIGSLIQGGGTSERMLEAFQHRESI